MTIRLVNIYPSIEYWHSIMNIRKIIVAEEDDEQIIVLFVTICIKNRRLQLAKELLSKILHDPP